MPRGKTRKPISKDGTSRVGAKVSHLMKKEGVTQKQAVAMALNMELEHRLTAKGGYKRVKKKSR